MNGTNSRKMYLTAATLTGVLLALAIASPSEAEHVSAESPISGARGAQLVIPMMNPERGKKVFVNKGCVTCHSVNGVGGHDAPAMDAHGQMGMVNPFDFAAKMWNHAPGMVAAQEDELGGQIYLTGEDLADIIAFLHDDEAQHGFSEKDLSKKAQEALHHGHGDMAASEAHAKEAGHGDEASKKLHGHDEGTAEHKD